MKTLRISMALTAMIFLLSCVQVSETQKQAEENVEAARDGVFIHLSHGSEDPHRVLMALNMAGLMAETQDVLVYFDIKGVNIVLNDSPDLVYKEFPSSHTQLKTLLEKNVPLMACPGCLKAADKTAEDLMEGVQVASKELFFDFTEGRILTLDY